MLYGFAGAGAGARFERSPNHTRTKNMSKSRPVYACDVFHYFFLQIFLANSTEVLLAFQTLAHDFDLSK